MSADHLLKSSTAPPGTPPAGDTAAGTVPAGLIFTDLDGSLLDHLTYDFSPAAGAVARALRAGVEIILCSSKTCPEMVLWQERLGIAAPFVVENGGGVFHNGGRLGKAAFPELLHNLPAVTLGSPIRELRELLAQASVLFGLSPRGFGDMDDTGVASVTGLTLPAARLALQRDFDEPFIWLSDPPPEALAAFVSYANDRGCAVERGGRFWHIMGRGGKGRAVEWLLNAYELEFGARPRSLALGDGENDLSMLRAADLGVAIRRPDGSSLATGHKGLRATSGIGPTGWNECVSEWLDRLGAD